MFQRVARPAADECSAYYHSYIDLVPDGDIVQTLAAQPSALHELLHAMGEAQAARRPTPGAWSAKEVLLHLSDTERLFSFRALWFARGEQSPLPGMEPDPWIAHTDANGRTLPELIAEWGHVRAASVALFANLDAAAWLRRGIASEMRISVRALAWLSAGHLLHHLRSLREEHC